MRVIVVIPAYNESRTIGVGVEECKQFAQEVIVVNDGSSDDTGPVASSRGAVVVSHIVNRGYGAALKTGILAALRLGAECVVTIDADGQHEPREITLLIDPLNKGEADIVIGNRFADTSIREGMSFFRHMLITSANLLTWFLYGVWCADTQSGFRAYSKKTLNTLCSSIGAEGMDFSSEVIGEASRHGMRIALVPITVRYTDYSLAKGQNIFTGMGTAFKLFLRRVMR